MFDQAAWVNAMKSIVDAHPLSDEEIAIMKSVMNGSQLPGEEAKNEELVELHVSAVLPKIEAMLLAIPASDRATAIEATRDWIFEYEPQAPLPIIRAFGVVVGNHVCDDKYGVKAAEGALGEVSYLASSTALH